MKNLVAKNYMVQTNILGFKNDKPFIKKIELIVFIATKYFIAKLQKKRKKMINFISEAMISLL